MYYKSSTKLGFRRTRDSRQKGASLTQFGGYVPMNSRN